MNYGLLKVQPHFVEKIWGGNISERWYNVSSPNKPIGEIWSVCATQQVTNFLPEVDLSLDQWLRQNPDQYPTTFNELPFRISIIDAKEDLSVQVHPTDEYAEIIGLPSGLSEAWLIIEADPHARIQLGHKAHTKEELTEKIENNQWNELLNYLPVSTDDVFFIEAGTMHAIGKGILVYEISQATDCTYRIYDYDRIDPTTNLKRELHIGHALNVLTVGDIGDHKITGQCSDFGSYRLYELIRSRFFDVNKIEVVESADIPLKTWGFLTVTSSSGMINGVQARAGDTFLVSNDQRSVFIEGSLTCMFASEGKSI